MFCKRSSVVVHVHSEKSEHRMTASLKGSLNTFSKLEKSNN